MLKIQLSIHIKVANMEQLTKRKTIIHLGRWRNQIYMKFLEKFRIFLSIEGHSAETTNFREIDSAQRLLNAGRVPNKLHWVIAVASYHKILNLKAFSIQIVTKNADVIKCKRHIPKFVTKYDVKFVPSLIISYSLALIPVEK